MDRPTQVASVFAAIGADLSGFNKGLSQARQDLGGFQGFMQNAGKDLTRVGRNMTMGITAPLVGMGYKMVQEASGFQAATNILDVAARQSGTGLDQLREAALAVGQDTQLVGIDAMEAADAMTNFYKAGLTTNDVFVDLNRYLEEGTNLTGALRAAIDLTAASDLDLAQASEAVAIAMATYGLEADQATRIADIFVGAADASIAEVSGLVDAVSTFGPTAAQFGWSLEDTNVALAVLSQRGIRGSEAGTALRSMMTNMMRDTKEVNEALEALNVSLYDEEGRMKSLPDIIGQLASSFQGLTEEQRNQYIQTLAGTYGMKAMQTLIAEGQPGWATMTQNMADAASAQEVGAKRTEGFAGKMENLQGAIQTFLIEAGLPFLDEFGTPAVERLSTIVSGLSELDPAVLATGIKLAGIAAAAGPALIVLGGLAQILGALPAAALLPLGALGLLAGALFLGSEKGETFRESMRLLGEELAKEEGLAGLAQIVSTITDLLDVLGKFGKGEYGLLFLITGKRPKEFFEEISTWGRDFFGTQERPGVVQPGRRAAYMAELEEGLPWRKGLTDWQTDVDVLKGKGREALTAYVGGARELLGAEGMRAYGVGDAAIIVPVGVSSQTEQIKAEGEAAGQAYGNAFLQTLDILLGGAFHGTILAAARAQGVR